MHSINVQGEYDSGRGRDGLGGVWPTDPYSDIASDVGNVYTAGWAGAPGLNAPKFVKSTGVTLDPAYAAKLARQRRIAPPPGKVVGVPTRAGMTRVGTPRGTRAPQRIKPPRRLPHRRRRPSKGEAMRNRTRFLHWIKRWNPHIYAQAVAAANRTQASGGTGALYGWFDDFTSKVADLGGKFLQFKTQKEILDAQMERLRSGLPPLETGQYAPTVGVQISPDPATTAHITGAIGTGLGKLATPLMLGGAALAAILLLRKK